MGTSSSWRLERCANEYIHWLCSGERSHSEVLPLDETHGVGEVPASGDHFLLQQGEGHGYEDEAEDEVDVTSHVLQLALVAVFERRPAAENNKNYGLFIYLFVNYKYTSKIETFRAKFNDVLFWFWTKAVTELENDTIIKKTFILFLFMNKNKEE